MIDATATSGGESQRVADARARAEQRVRRQRDVLRPLGWAVIFVVVTGAAGANPSPGLHGRQLGVTLALCAFAGAIALAIRSRFIERGVAFQAAVIAAMGAAGVALVGLQQSQGTSQLAGGAAVFMAVTRLPLPVAVAFGAVMAGAMDVTAAVSGGSSAAILANTLVLALLGLVAYFIKQARASQDHTELLLAQLEDARAEQTQLAALAERSRIAGELHDVLAHSLSGAAIQLQAARKLAERERAAPPVRAAIDRAGELVKDGLADARQAVGALRGEELPGVMQLELLVSSFRSDLGVDVTMTVDGDARELPADTGLALYRGAQEALTNVARYAAGATASVALRYDRGRTTLCIEDRLPAKESSSPGEQGLEGVGGGRGLAGMRERLERAGGTMQAGPTENGWRVELTVPA